MGERVANQWIPCSVGAYCAHAILTAEIGVYRCPFGACFKRRGS